MDAGRSVISFIRRNPWNYNGAVLAVISFSPMEYADYCVGVPTGGFCSRVFSTYDHKPSEEGFDESGRTELIETEEYACDGYDHRIRLHLRPFESVILELSGIK